VPPRTATLFRTAALPRSDLGTGPSDSEDKWIARWAAQKPVSSALANVANPPTVYAASLLRYPPAAIRLRAPHRAGALGHADVAPQCSTAPFQRWLVQAYGVFQVVLSIPCQHGADAGERPRSVCSCGQALAVNFAVMRRLVVASSATNAPAVSMAGSGRAPARAHLVN
jgi:hypothetical protein